MMKSGTKPLAVAMLTLSASSAECEAEWGISVVAPELAVPGKTTAVLVTLHGPQRAHPLNVTLRLVSDRAEEMTQLLLETSQEITGGVDRRSVLRDVVAQLLFSSAFDSQAA
uniref:Uncharacterized protein n=1 Tax=Timema douglasi TaxID=61478 RepID=A0A7R8Z726_TIMDO|nr:unnamed protein product [Timema douglasi]